MNLGPSGWPWVLLALTDAVIGYMHQHLAMAVVGGVLALCSLVSV